MNINFQEILLTILVSAVSVAIAFYLKKFLQQKLQYRKLKRKLEQIAGKNAQVLYDDELYKISDIDENGIMLDSEMRSIFVPTSKLLQSEMVLPSNKYHEILERQKEEEQLRKIQEFQKVVQGTEAFSSFGQFTDMLVAQGDTLFKKDDKLSPDKIADELIQKLMEIRVLPTADPVHLLGAKLAKVLIDEGIIEKDN